MTAIARRKKPPKRVSGVVEKKTGIGAELPVNLVRQPLSQVQIAGALIDQ
ncbi:hypothetical protein ACXHXG_28830 [Rhizobium sp. LEGMi198b]|nr:MULTISPECIES: hypothetical protein [Rhizobium]MDK4737598.1 hypothetical protein [Rhizobium sp. CNPSo 3464]UWU22734.1 hypothetical protein N2601_07245 [Rhizobium tropici]